MARAKRHYIPGHIWHITHRCHKREFLFRFSKDRHRWLQWLYEAKKRYGLIILNYIVTSNHIHLLVYDHSGRKVIPKSIQLTAGRTGQEYNQRKKRQGAFWQDRYHATAVESGEHLLRCIIYIDLNMVRAGVVAHPSQWAWSGYNEIQNPRRKCVLINNDMLTDHAGFNTFEHFQTEHGKLVNQSLADSENIRENQWSESVAVGSEKFAAETKALLGCQARGRRIHKTGEDDYQLRERVAPYNSLFNGKKDHIAPENAYYWHDFN